MHKKQLIFGALVVLLVGGAGCSWWKNNTGSSPAGTVDQTVATSTAAATSPAATSSPKTITPAKKVTATKSTTPTKSTGTPTSETYQKTLNAYRSSGAYFQFVSCRATPGTLSLKKGVRFMLDNRDGKAHRIAIQGKATYSVGAYNYAIATAPAPGKYYITCDGGGSAQINVEG